MTSISSRSKRRSILADRTEYSKQWYQKNKQRILDKQKARYKKTPDRSRLFQAAKQRAREKNLEFSIELEDIIIPQVCPILKELLVPNSQYAPSVDRLDNSLGYTKDNVWVISKRANLMKNDANFQDLERFADWVRTLKP